MIRLILGLSAILTVACATAPTPEEAAAADYGPYPMGYEDVIKEHMRGRLKDPYGAQCRFLNPPMKGWQRLGGRTFGWIVCADINAKNSYGGYIGFKRRYFMLRHGRIVKTYGGGNIYDQALADAACSQAPGG